MSSEEDGKLKRKTNMNHYKGNITPGKDIIPDNIWFSEEWYKAMNSEPNKTNQ